MAIDSFFKNDGIVEAVFSHKTPSEIGTGTTKKRGISKILYFIAKDGDQFFKQSLNSNFVPCGPKMEITAEEIYDEYQLEPDIYLGSVKPMMCELNKHVKRGDKNRDKGALYSAEFDYSQARDIDIDHIRASFGLGLVYLDRGEPQKAQSLFGKIVTLDEAFAPVHKHLFNEFGIKLRAAQLYAEAIEFYKRALELDAADDNLFYNLARSYYSLGDARNCFQFAEKCLVSNPNPEAIRSCTGMLEYSSIQIRREKQQ